VPYVVSIQCLDSAPRARRLACREAYPVAERFLKALRLAGGQPSRPRSDIASVAAVRPAALSRDFSYRPSGDIIARTGSRRQSGRATAPPIRRSAFRCSTRRSRCARHHLQGATRPAWLAAYILAR